MDMNSLAHTKWECKYHLVFAPKYRRQIIYGKIKADVGQILSTICKRMLLIWNVLFHLWKNSFITTGKIVYFIAIITMTMNWN